MLCIHDRSLRSNSIDIPLELQNTYIESGCEILCFDVHFQLFRIRFILVYRPPCYVAQSTADLKLSALTKIILSISSTKDPIILLGNLNFPDIDCNLFRLNNSTHNNCFIECMQSLGMVQFVSDSKRVSTSTSQNILDLVFSNDTNYESIASFRF